MAATTGRDEPPLCVAGGPENPSADPVLVLSGRSGSRVRARWILGEGGSAGAVLPVPCAGAVRSRVSGRMRTGGEGAAAAERWTGAAAGLVGSLGPAAVPGARDEGPGGTEEGPVGGAGALGMAGAGRTGIGAGAVGGAGVGRGAVPVAAGPGPGARSASGRVTVDRRSPSSGAPPSRAVGGSAASGAPIPPRPRARVAPEVLGPGTGARCTEGEGSDGFEDG
ncbi:hypothetical protein ACFYT7_00095 [Streptomyces sp. NPDC004041]|uniref:hypothetical protein n=1 Tax=Streptomyces sp. NPDC004041 TaxID=3364688 RepID=UPI00368F71B7